MQVSGETIRMLRHLHGMKQETFAKKLDISQPAYCKLEKSEKINGDRAIKIIEAMGYTKEEFEKLVEQPPPLPENELELAVGNSIQQYELKG